MELLVRPARPDDACVALLYESAKPYYDAYAGTAERAVGMLRAIYARRGHAASFEYCRVATRNGAIVGVVAGFPVRDADRLARRFVQLTVVRLPPWRWPGTVRHLRAAGAVSPHPPRDAFYIDALAVDAPYRRPGVAPRVLEEAEREAARSGLRGVALDTGIANAPARALYRAYGFTERDVRRAPSARAARAIGGPGFVGYFKA